MQAELTELGSARSRASRVRGNFYKIMAGKFLNNNRVHTSIQNWYISNIPPSGRWEGNDIHIDEIDSLKSTLREDWIDISFKVLNTISAKFEILDSFLLFLHIDLKDSTEKLNLNTLSLKWLKENIGKYTPPSLHLTSKDYYTNFYAKELVVCNPDYSILELVYSSAHLAFFYRTYYDENEAMYSREIYVFLKKLE